MSNPKQIMDDLNLIQNVDRLNERVQNGRAKIDFNLRMDCGGNEYANIKLSGYKNEVGEGPEDLLYQQIHASLSSYMRSIKKRIKEQTDKLCQD